MIKKSLLFTFWLEGMIALFVIGQFFVPLIKNFIREYSLFLVPLMIFSLVGGILTFLVQRGETKGKLRWFLMLTGISSAGFFVGVFLHNIFYALGTITSNLIFLHLCLQILAGGFFLFAAIVCPLAFCFGMGGSIILLWENRKKNLNRQR